MLKKLLNILDNFEEKALTVILSIMVVVIFMATFFRFTKILIIPWAEELARYLMVWLVFLGIGAGAKSNRHFTVDNLVNALPKSTYKIFFIIRTVIIVTYCSFIGYIGFGLINSLKIMGQTSPALRMPIWFVYSAIPVGLTIMIVRTLQFAIRKYVVDKDSNI
ncbi:MAG: TRAP transporter small permease [Sedimentibacter sp.]